ncbi:MAG: hypothetical protein ACPGQL_08165 [Thermoplasmatota archaeon]
MRSLLVALVAATLLSAAPAAVAHGSAVVVESPATGKTCYVYNSDLGSPEFWEESNGDSDGGADNGLALLNHFGLGDGETTGLQRGGSDPDTQYESADAWLTGCVLGA